MSAAGRSSRSNSGRRGARGPVGYQLLAEILAGELSSSGEDSVERAERAGRGGALSRHRRPPHATATASEDIDAVLRLLEEAGFDPALEPDEAGHGAHASGARSGSGRSLPRKIVCAVHLGLMQGALAELGAHVEADRLVPFARPGICSAHLGEVAVS